MMKYKMATGFCYKVEDGVEFETCECHDIALSRLAEAVNAEMQNGFVPYGNVVIQTIMKNGEPYAFSAVQPMIFNVI